MTSIVLIVNSTFSPHYLELLEGVRVIDVSIFETKKIFDAARISDFIPTPISYSIKSQIKLG